MRPPGRGDFWVLKIAQGPSPKNLSKNRSAPERGVAFLWKAFLQKTFQVREKILIKLMARGRLVAHATISVRMSTIKEYRVPSKASRV